MRTGLVSITLTMIGGLIACRKETKPGGATSSDTKSGGATSSARHFTLPGWEDVVIGGNPLKDTPCKFLDRAKADDCTGTRQAGIGELSQIEFMRRSDVGIAFIVAQLDEPAARALRKRWGSPTASTKETTTWCSPDGSEGALLTTREFVAPMVVISILDKAQDFFDDWPFERPKCAAVSARKQTENVGATDSTNTRSAATKPTSNDQPAPIATLTATIRASSTHKPAAGYTFTPENLLDGDPKTSWQPEPSDKTPWIEFDFDVPVTIRDVQIANGFQTVDRFGDEFLLNDRLSAARLRFDDGTEIRISFAEDARGLVAHAVAAKRTRSLRLQTEDVWRGTKWHDLAISEVKIRGDCECWMKEEGAANPEPCDDNERDVWLETGPCGN